MPILGYGLFKVEPKDAERCVRDAIDVGYRMIDTAQFYANEQLIASDTRLMAWGPMGQGKYDFFNHPVLMSIGEKYGKTASQVGLRFLVQQGIPVIPKSVSIQRMKENINIFDFNLDESDMDMLRGLNIHDNGSRDYNDPVYAQRIVSQVF